MFLQLFKKNRLHITAHPLLKSCFRNNKRKNSAKISVVAECCVFVGNIRIQDKMEINFDAWEFTISYRKVVQIALVSEVTMAKKIRFHINQMRRLRSYQSILLSVVGECCVFDGNIRIQDKME